MKALQKSWKMISSPSSPVRQTMWLRRCAVKYQVFKCDVTSSFISLNMFTLKTWTSVVLICFVHKQCSSLMHSLVLFCIQVSMQLLNYHDFLFYFKLFFNGQQWFSFFFFFTFWFITKCITLWDVWPKCSFFFSNYASNYL